MKASNIFKKGDRVRPTEEAHTKLRMRMDIRGTVVGFGTKFDTDLRVVKDGEKTVQNYHLAFWEKDDGTPVVVRLKKHRWDTRVTVCSECGAMKRVRKVELRPPQYRTEFFINGKWEMQTSTPPCCEPATHDVAAALRKPLSYDELDGIIAADGRGWLESDGVIAIFNALKKRGLCIGEAPPMPDLYTEKS